MKATHLWRFRPQGTQVSKRKTAVDIVSAIKQCGKTKDLQGGKKLHQDAVTAGCHADKYVVSALINMYMKCRSMQNARKVFDHATYKDVVMWTSLMLGYVENGESFVALELFSNMGCEPDHVTYVAALKACARLAVERDSERQFYLNKGAAIHEQVRERGLEQNVILANALLDMYGKCGSMQCAIQVFERMPQKDVIAWNSLMLGYVENGESMNALEFFSRMDCEPDHFTYIAALKACARLKELDKGRDIHRQAKEHGLDSHINVGNTLLHMYGKCGSTEGAIEVFQRMMHKDVVSWNCLILGYVENGESWRALELYARMDCVPDHATYVAALKACAKLAQSDRQFSLEKGVSIHMQVKARGLDTDRVLASSLIEMYSECGSMRCAREVFDCVTHKDVVVWNSVIHGYVENGESLIALDLFASVDCEPDVVTYIGLLKACARLAIQKKDFYLKKAISIHTQVKHRGFDTSTSVGNVLIDMYSKYNSMLSAREVFERMPIRDVVTWNTLMLGYVENEEHSLALELFNSMECQPDHVTYVAALKACVGLAGETGLQRGVSIHRQIGSVSCLVLGNTLLDMYSKCNSMEHAREVFESMGEKDVVTWSSLILGYVENGESSVALELFDTMECEPDCVTYIAALKACGNLALLPAGRWIHSRVCKHGLEEDQVVANALVDVYGKCGSMARAEGVFDEICSPDIVSFTALLSGYSSLGDFSRVFSLVEKIQESGLQMDRVVFICVLMVCSHAGLIHEAQIYFESMFRYSIVPGVEHYNCMVDMLGRANRLEEALSIVSSMPCKPNSYTWTSLLGSCRKWKNLQVGKAAFDALVAENTKDGGAYTLMGDIYENFE